MITAEQQYQGDIDKILGLYRLYFPDFLILIKPDEYVPMETILELQIPIDSYNKTVNDALIDIGGRILYSNRVKPSFRLF